MRNYLKGSAVAAAVFLGVSLSVSSAFAFETGDLRELLGQGLLGAGVGAISADVSGGKAGTGALVGAGTNILGGVVMGLLSNQGGGRQAVYSQASYVQPVYSQPVYAQPVVQQTYYEPEPVYYAPQTTYASYEDPNKKLLKNGLLGAGVGAISAEASGGKAGTGALIGAGTNVIGSALSDYLFSAPSAGASQPVYYAQAPASAGYASPSTAGKIKHVIRKFDSAGHVLSEEEFWQ
ncbi:MAG TPA: hypothetical protein VL404_03420 [Candidatus Eisenbacteria bacterium]|nr:hypothetical protein [Candidatus Eisenbacteria bacterium]